MTKTFTVSLKGEEFDVTVYHSDKYGTKFEVEGDRELNIGERDIVEDMAWELFIDNS
jgi:hypothetical protein